MMNVLFVCSMNQWRSPTAEKIYGRRPDLSTRSCGTSRNARVSASSALLSWADMVLVMEDKHRRRLTADFPGDMKHKQTHVLDIPDDYQLMDPQLIMEIESAVEPLLKDD